jgi:predicted RNase H-like nuclease (RuvC/YqgF family)
LQEARRSEADLIELIARLHERKAQIESLKIDLLNLQAESAEAQKTREQLESELMVILQSLTESYAALEISEQALKDYQALNEKDIADIKSQRDKAEREGAAWKWAAFLFGGLTIAGGGYIVGHALGAWK